MVGAVKHDGGKSPISLIPRSAILAEAEVLRFGAEKYAAHNWRKGMHWSRMIDAALRHLFAFADGEDDDVESGISHLAHAKCCLSFLIEYLTTHPDLDDRYKKELDQCNAVLLKSLSRRMAASSSASNSPRSATSSRSSSARKSTRSSPKSKTRGTKSASKRS